jgi:7-cyano-7-deazaguanine synthase
MDSLWLLANALQKNPKQNIFVIHFQYGQKTAPKELECFYACLGHYEIPQEQYKIIKLDFLPSLLKSSLTSQSIEVNTQGIDLSGKALPTSYVPFRNTIFLSLALSWAETDDINEIHIGAVSEDAMGYPDCRPEYYDQFNKLIKVGSRDGSIKIVTPVIQMKKSAIIKDLRDWKSPIEHTWSCYQSNDLECGKCDSCLLKQAALNTPKS